jgi:hypothetical protein
VYSSRRQIHPSEHTYGITNRTFPTCQAASYKTMGAAHLPRRYVSADALENLLARSGRVLQVLGSTKLASIACRSVSQVAREAHLEDQAHSGRGGDSTR